MKNSVKLFFATLVLVAISASSYAQSNANANVAASATVLTALTITNNHAVAFGNVSATTPGVVFLDPQGTANAYVGTTAAIGKFTIAGANSQSVKLTWPEYITLQNGTPTNLNYVLAVSGKTTDVQSTSADLTLTSGSVDVSTSASGAYFLYVGGSLGGATTVPAALSSQEAGTYTGTANFTVVYN